MCDGEGLAEGEEIEGLVGRGIAKGDQARAGAGAVGLAECQRARRGQGRLLSCRQGAARPREGRRARGRFVRVGEVDVGEGERAGASVVQSGRTLTYTPTRISVSGAPLATRLTLCS
jgi:hypothetical protein